MIDIKKEQQASIDRPRYKYSPLARMFFTGMDMIAGRKTTLGKAKLLEILASIPYRAWEYRQYGRMTRGYGDPKTVRETTRIANYAREAQDNEFWHLQVINEKMRVEGADDPWYYMFPIPFAMLTFYRLMSRTLALFCIRRSFLFNAQFEDHAEHIYAQFVADHPEWDEEPVESDVVLNYDDFKNWGDVFRRISLDERDHRNRSFVLAGRPEAVVEYEGMPPIEEAC